MKLAIVLAAVLAALPPVQPCCNSHFNGIGDGDNGAVSFQRDLRFDRILTPPQAEAYTACRAGWYAKAAAWYGQSAVDRQYPDWVPDTYPGGCNMFGCHCDHCYGAEDCQGTSDRDAGKQANRWKLSVGDAIDHKHYDDYITHDCPALRGFKLPGYTGVCTAATGASAGAGAAGEGAADAANDAANGGDTGGWCADKDAVLSEPLPRLAARLSAQLCDPSEPSNGGVGEAFAAALVASLDADKDGAVDCGEWQIAKMAAAPRLKLQSGYRGPSKLEVVPFCKLSAQGEDKLARYNAYLAGLAAEAATAATADGR